MLEDLAVEITVGTVNKGRARSGEAETARRPSVRDLSSSRRGGLRSHSGQGGRTHYQLYKEARERGIHGRSKINTGRLECALSRKR